MKKNWLNMAGLGLMLHFSCALAAPLDSWHWRNPLPNGNPPYVASLNGIVFATGKFVAVGASGVVSISTDATNWTESTTATTNDLNGVVYANSVFVAAGNNGVVETSTDATHWVLQYSGTPNPLTGIAFANGKFVALGPNAIIASANAINWTPAVSGVSGATAVAGGTNGFVAVVGSQPYSNEAFFSSDGLHWTTETFPSFNGSPFGSFLNIVTYVNGVYLMGGQQYDYEMSVDTYILESADGTNWNTIFTGNNYAQGFYAIYNCFLVGSNNAIAAGAFPSAPFFEFSTNMTNWTYHSSPIAGLTAGAYGNGNYVFLAPSKIYSSTDTLTWTNRQQAPAPAVGPTNTFTCIASNNGVFVVASGNLFAISTNGLSYVIASNTPTASCVVTFSNEFVGVGPDGGIYVSSNGLSWTQHTSATANSLHGVAVGNGLLVAVGDGGAIQTSATGLIWTSRNSGTSLALFSLVYSNGIFVAVGQQGTVLTSSDGINWTGQYSGVLSNLLSVAYGTAGFLAVGLGGTMVTSLDGTNWISQNPGTMASLESVSFGNGYYFATGDNGMALSSPDGVTWTSHNLGLAGGQNLYGSAFINSRFEVVGANGTILESDVIAPLFDVQFHLVSPQNRFTMFAPPGSNFRLQVSTNLAMGWSEVTSFNNVSGITQWTNSSGGYKQQFYRLVSP